MCIAAPNCQSEGSPAEQSTAAENGSGAKPEWSREWRGRSLSRVLRRVLHAEPCALQQQLLTRMQRVGSRLPKGKQVASRSSSAALAEQNRVAILPVQLLREDVAASWDDVQVENGFQMKMDAHGFTPEELVVQVDGQCLIVTAQRQMQGYNLDGGCYHMAENMHRQMQLPPYLDPAAMNCCLTPSGQLCVRGQCRVPPSPESPTSPSLFFRSRGSKNGST